MKMIAACLLLTFLLFLALPAAGQMPERRARQLLDAFGCRACHSIEGRGGEIGPSLDAVGSRLTAEQIQQQLLAPRSRNEQSIMPSFAQLPAEDLAVLIEFLSSRRSP